tara:strand:- start:364 stop:1239 length:876 start_codon:yes stop_codon:yes gene_type:complete
MTPMITNLFELIRLRSWIKNTIIFAPLFFSGKIKNISDIYLTTIAFLAFSFLTSSIYILNDFIDLNHDRLHPIKKKRPLASSKIRVKSALLLAALLLLSSLFLIFQLSISTTYIFLIYLIIMSAYCLYFRKIALIDITIIAFGFVLRIYVGSTISQIEISSWIIIMTFLLALFIALSKRRDDLINQISEDEYKRKSLDGYNLKLIDSLLTTLSPTIIVCYILYCISDINISRIGQDFYLTSIYVIFGFSRYFQLVYVYNKGGDPIEILYKDIYLKLILLFWILNFSWVLYY